MEARARMLTRLHACTRAHPQLLLQARAVSVSLSAPSPHPSRRAPLLHLFCFSLSRAPACCKESIVRLCICSLCTRTLKCARALACRRAVG
eukprot:6077698-Pleurochrysis_carterae.AAC.3